MFAKTNLLKMDLCLNPNVDYSCTWKPFCIFFFLILFYFLFILFFISSHSSTPNIPLGGYHFPSGENIMIEFFLSIPLICLCLFPAMDTSPGMFTDCRRTIPTHCSSRMILRSLPWGFCYMKNTVTDHITKKIFLCKHVHTKLS